MKDYKTNITKARKLLSEVSKDFPLKKDDITGEERSKESQIVEAINLLEELLEN